MRESEADADAFAGAAAERRWRRTLTDRARAGKASREERMQLAEWHRAAGNPDQAARWGIIEAGWATDAELDRLARWLSRDGAWVKWERQRAVRYLAIPEDLAGDEVNARIDELSRAAIRKRKWDTHERRVRETPKAGWLYVIGGSMIGLSVGAGLVVQAVVTVSALFGALPGGVVTARSAGMWAWSAFAVFGLGWVAIALGHVLRGRPGWATCCAIVGAAITSAAALGIAFVVS